MLTIHGRLRFGSYDAASDADPRRPEWPPHPARIFCALVASDPTPDEWRALEWLEQQDPPEVVAPDLLDVRSDMVFVPTNETKAGGPSLPGRINGARTKPRALPADNGFAVSWPAASPEADVVVLLDELAARVGYVGRSTASASLHVDTKPPAVAAGVTYAPTGTPELDLRAPYSGYCERLIDAHETGARAWEVSRQVGYAARYPEAEPAPEVAEGPFGRLIVFEPVRPTALHTSNTAPIAERLRKAVMSIVEPLPPEVSGHGADARTHVAYLALPNVGTTRHLPGAPEGLRVQPNNQRADGRILAFALALPRGADELAFHLYRSLKSDLSVLELGGGERVRIAPLSPASTTLGAKPDRWNRASAVWATATPLVFDQYPKGRSPEEMVAQALVTAGYPEPEVVVTSRSPILPGAGSPPRSAVRRRAGVPTKPSTHAWVQFPLPVAGPVIAGSMRYRGLGLFSPLTIDERVPEQGQSA